MNTVQKLLIPFVCGFLVCPASIVLHEFGHLLAGKSLGWDSRLHYSETRSDVPKEKLTRRSELLTTSAGPMVGVILTAVGFVWLRSVRRPRLGSIATIGDWVATSLVIFSMGRWVRSFAALPSSPMPEDEAFISRAMGLPSWLLPYFLGVVAIIVIIATIRLHPSGSRLKPCLVLTAGGIVGTVVWMKGVGPVLLP
jgi:hypothetical protein